MSADEVGLVVPEGGLGTEPLADDRASDRAGTNTAWRRKPIFWLTAVLLAAGGLFCALELALYVVRFPEATVLAVALGVLYAVPFFVIVHRLDFFEREPLRLTLLAFAWGAVVAIPIAGIGNDALGSLIAKLDGPALAETWGAALSAPFIEEPLKVLAVVVVALLVARQVGSALDGVIYGAMSGLGFQTMENLTYQLSFVEEIPGHPQVEPVIQLFVLRNLLSGLWSHAAYTAIAGAGVAYFMVRKDKPVSRRLAVAGVAFLAAVSLHLVWNSPLPAAIEDSTGWVLLSLFVKGIPAAVLVFAIYRRANRQEARSTTAALQGDVLTGLIGQEELAALATRRTRRRFRNRLRDQAGRRAARLGRQLQHAEARLAATIRRADPPDRVADARRRVRETRQKLDDALAELGTPRRV